MHSVVHYEQYAIKGCFELMLHPRHKVCQALCSSLELRGTTITQNVVGQSMALVGVPLLRVTRRILTAGGPSRTCYIKQYGR